MKERNNLSGFCGEARASWMANGCITETTVKALKKEFKWRFFVIVILSSTHNPFNSSVLQ